MDSSAHTAFKALEQLPLFKGIDKALIELLASHSTIKSFAKGSTLFVQEEPSHYVYAILNGWVKCYRETLDGNESIVDILNTPHLFAVSALFGDEKSNYGALVIEDAELLLIPNHIIRGQLQINNQFAMNMLAFISNNQKHKVSEIEHRDLQTAPQRIGCFLLRLCTQNQAEPAILRLPYDKTLIACRLGMKPETFSRALAKLKQETGITIQGSTVTIHDIQQLAEYTCKTCSSCYPCEDLAA